MARLSKALVFSLLAGSAVANPVEDAFRAFKSRFAKKYSSDKEEQARLEIFRSNFAFIEAANARGGSYRLGVNEFADLTSDEFRAARTGLLPIAPSSAWKVPYLGLDSYSGAQLDDSVDWAAKGAVTPVKNQARCGSCWAFSTTGALEGAWKVATGNLVSISEQQLVDCSTSNHGCHGGSMDLAFTFAESQALCTEDSYPYTAADGTCQTNCTIAVPQGAVTGYKDVTADDAQALMEAVAQQPVSVAIEADQRSFQLYHSGVLTADDCGTKLDHGVLLVGYGSDSGVDYWKVKNSWGATWGEQGFVRITRGGTSTAGECGILSHPSYPVVANARAASPVVV